MRTILSISILFLCNVCYSQNFIGPQEFTKLAEEARLKSSQYWGYQMPDWAKPCQVYYDGQLGRDGGVTTFDKTNGAVYNFVMKIGGDYPSIIPHEVDHAVRHSIVNNQQIPRWLDEGSATQFEPLSNRSRAFYELVRINKNNIQTSTLSNNEYQTDPRNNELLYAFGYTAVQLLLERDSPQTLICFQQDSRPINEKFVTYYDMSSEQFMETWRQRVDHMEPRCYVPYPAGFPIINNKPLLSIWVSNNELSQTILRDIQIEPLKSYLISNYHVRIIPISPLTVTWANLNWITRTPTVLVPALRKQFGDYRGPEDLIHRLSGNVNPFVREEPKSDDNTVLPPPNLSNDNIVTPTPTTSPVNSGGLTPDDLNYGQENPPDNKFQTYPNVPAGQIPGLVPNTQTPVVTQPIVTQPVVTQPVVTEPIIIQPSPINTEPVVTQPTVAKRSWGDFRSKLLGLAGDTIISMLPLIVGATATGGTGGALYLLFKALPLIGSMIPKRGGASSIFQRNAIDEGLLPRQMDEVRSLLELAKKEGRVPLLDCFRGVTYDDQISKMIGDVDKPEIKNALLELKNIVEEKVQQTAPISTKI